MCTVRLLSSPSVRVRVRPSVIAPNFLGPLPKRSPLEFLPDSSVTPLGLPSSKMAEGGGRRRRAHNYGFATARFLACLSSLPPPWHACLNNVGGRATEKERSPLSHLRQSLIVEMWTNSKNSVPRETSHYRDRLKGVQNLLSNSQAGRNVKQE